MKTAIVFAAICVVIASAGPVYNVVRNQDADAQIITIQNDNIGVGGYNWNFETSDGQKREEHAQVVFENDEPTQVITGSYSYIGADGLTYTVNYTADKNGFHPEILKPTH